MIIQRVKQREWEYKVDDKYFTISIDDALEHWLKKGHFEVETDNNTIVRLKGLSMEKILEHIIENENKVTDFYFYSKDINKFETAIRELSLYN